MSAPPPPGFRAMAAHTVLGKAGEDGDNGDSERLPLARQFCVVIDIFLDPSAKTSEHFPIDCKK